MSYPDLPAGQQTPWQGILQPTTPTVSTLLGILEKQLRDMLRYASDRLSPATTAGIVVGTGAGATIKIANTIYGSVNGVYFTKAGTDNIAMTACTTQATNTDCLYLFSITTGGTVTTTKSNEVPTGGVIGLPELPANNAPIGYVKISTTTATFTSGTTSMTTPAGFTLTLYDLSCMPYTVGLG
jgi:hypothetical protein